MRHGQTRRKRLATAARWPVGVLLTAWRYLWRLTPVVRWERGESQLDEPPPRLPATLELQRAGDGVGPLFHRRYRLRVRGAALEPEALVAAIAADLDRVAPSEFASFQKVSGEEGTLRVGDEYVVRMPGPWDGPVRVVAAEAASFRLATLDGHLEAGQIRFGADTRDGLLEFTIESWARSGDRLSHVLYSRLLIAKEVQTHMWTSVLERVAELSGGRREGPLTVVTRVVDDEVADDALSGPSHRRARRALAALADRSLNFDPAVDPTREAGWRIDDLTRELPSEVPGPPVPEGSWEIAKRLMIDYQVADPAMVRATYRRGAPLAGRDMLLQVRFAGLRFYVGVRVGDVYEETRTVDGRECRVFGWSYSTLRGHFEQGRLHYEVWKWCDSGAVEFRLRAFSRPADDGSWLLRTGFRLVGRANQLNFYARAARRVARFTAAELELRAAA